MLSPVFKSLVPVYNDVGERSTTKNYRPISFLSVFSKIFKKNCK